jgi:hypothetical protein
MKLRPASRKEARIKLAIQGPSGSGKTYSSLLLAKGLVKDYAKVAIIDTESGSADLYAHLGKYHVLNLEAPYTPEKYIKAIDMCEASGMEVIIIDSISHCWEELLHYHGQLTGNSFANWSKVTPRQNAFIRRILDSTSHVIATLRVKQDYILADKGNGRTKVEKVGLKTIQRDGVDYEFTLVFDLDMKHNARTSKDRTGLFTGKPEFIITQDTGSELLAWCQRGIKVSDVSKMIDECKDEQELISLYKRFPEFYKQLAEEFRVRKQILEGPIQRRKAS